MVLEGYARLQGGFGEYHRSSLLQPKNMMTKKSRQQKTVCLEPTQTSSRVNEKNSFGIKINWVEIKQNTSLVTET